MSDRGVRRVATGPPPVIVDRGPLSQALINATPVALDDRQRERLARYRDLLLGWNERINLTAITEPEAVERVLILDALRLAPAIRSAAVDRPSPLRLIDIGTGGGLPGLPLAIALPEIDFTLLDATGKKVTFLNEVIRDLELGNAVALHGRAEEIGHLPAYRGQFDFATARAVASLATLFELALPLLKVSGQGFFPKSAAIEGELEEAERAAPILGGHIASAELLPFSTDEQVTRLVILAKIAQTSSRFPRRAGVPVREPLGKGRSR